MKKIIVAIVLAVGAVLAGPAAQAQVAPFPTAPACVQPSIRGGDVAAPWASVESACSVSLSGDPRSFVTFVENYADYLNASLSASAADLTARDATVASQRQTIEDQRSALAEKNAVIARLRAKLARAH